jgi:hypothetical protein
MAIANVAAGDEPGMNAAANSLAMFCSVRMA